MNVKALVAKKIGMTRMMNPEGQMVAVTLLQIEEQKITKILTADRDGYSAVQVGYFTKRDTRLTKADHARLRKVNVAENFARFKEFRSVKPVEGLEAGASLTAAVLDGVKAVDVTGFTKGRGFTGS
ncbi:MAG: 50S ribosomal protein L3, partial [Proteobacteria bacterium]|nr:50S ribosomal protein L3 [Pseudomonadota bacterium]